MWNEYLLSTLPTNRALVLHVLSSNLYLPRPLHRRCGLKTVNARD